MVLAVKHSFSGDPLRRFLKVTDRFLPKARSALMSFILQQAVTCSLVDRDSPHASICDVAQKSRLGHVCDP